MGALRAAGHWARAVGLLREMAGDGVRPDVVNFNIAISACASVGAWLPALGLLQNRRVRQARAAPDAVTFNALISACDRAAESDRARACLQGMGEARVAANAVTYSTVMSAVAKSGDWRCVLELFGSMPSHRISQDSVCYSVVIAACERASSWTQSLSLFNSMCELRVERDVVVLGNVMCAYGKAERWADALELLQAMRRDGVPLDTIAANSSLGVFANSARWQEALGLVYDMGRLGITKTTATCNALIRALVHAKEYERAIGALVHHFPADDVAHMEADPRRASTSMFRSARPDAVTIDMREAIADRLERLLDHSHAREGTPAQPSTARAVVAVPAEGLAGAALLAGPAPDAAWLCPEADAAARAVASRLAPPDAAAELRAVRGLLDGLRRALPAAWRGAQVLPYGSSVGGFAGRGGDVDVTVMVPLEGSARPGGGACTAEGLRHLQQRALLEWRRHLLGRGWQVSTVGLGGRVPVLTVRWGPGGGRTVDITVRNMLGVHKSGLLREYASLDPRLCGLVRIVKHWARRRGVFGQTCGYPGRTKRYAYTLLAIFFAQSTSPPLIPSLQALAPSRHRWMDDAGTLFDVAWLSADQVRPADPGLGVARLPTPGRWPRWSGASSSSTRPASPPMAGAARCAWAAARCGPWRRAAGPAPGGRRGGSRWRT
ncbi:unnamed protein product, partial [Prorocentrum cordatum]